MSQINTSNIDASFPKQGQDNPSGGFRENFSAIKLALDNASQEITALQTSPGQSLIILGDGLTINTFTGATTLVAATANTIGGVQIGEGISVTDTGTISVSLIQPATNTILGGVKIGSGINTSTDGTISVTPYTLTTATTSTLGGIIIGKGLYAGVDGTLNVTTSSNLPVASTTTNGIVRIGQGILVSATGTISVQAYTLPTASTLVKGGVKVYAGGSIAVQADGTISTNINFLNGTGTQYAETWPNDGITPPSIWWDLLPATTSTLGGVVLDLDVISLTTLKSIVAASTSWGDFQTNIAAL